MKHPGYEITAPDGYEILAPPRRIIVGEDGTRFLEDEADWLSRWAVLCPAKRHAEVVLEFGSISGLTPTNSGD